MAISRAELKKIPYLDIRSIGTRVIPTTCFRTDGKWEHWLDAGDKLIPLISFRPVEMVYFGMDSDSGDVYLEFLNLVYQHASQMSVMRPLTAIVDDLLNLSASLGKFELMFEVSQTSSKSKFSQRMVLAEIEYILITCRSVFDLLQKVIFELWKLTNLDVSRGKKISLAEERFVKMVLFKDEPMTAEQISKRYNLPKQLAEYYLRTGPFFLRLREMRDTIAHGVNAQKPMIFETDLGFAVFRDAKPFNDLSLWASGKALPNQLVSLRPVLAHFILGTFTACEDFAETFGRTIGFPPPIAPGYRAYLKGEHVHQLGYLQEVVAKSLWWRDLESFETKSILAYSNWEKRGRPVGDSLTDWLQAEAYLKI